MIRFFLFTIALALVNVLVLNGTFSFTGLLINYSILNFCTVIIFFPIYGLKWFKTENNLFFTKVLFVFWIWVCFWLVVTFYIGLFGSKILWGKYLDIGLVKTNIPYLQDILRALPFEFYWAYILCLITFLVSFFLPFIYIKRIKYFLKRYFNIKIVLTHFLLLAVLKLALLGINKNELIASLNNDPYINFFLRDDKHNRIQTATQPYLDSLDKEGTHNEKNVIIIVVDALRADHMGLYGYKRNTTPFIDSLYDNDRLKKVDVALASNNNTLPSLLSILFSDKLENTTQKRIGLHEVLKHFNYNLNFILSGVHRDWYGLSDFYGDNIDFYREGSDSKLFDLNDDHLILEHLKEVPRFKDVGKSFFLFHLMSVHGVGTINEKYRVFKPNKVNFMGSDRNSKCKAYTNNYDNGILQADNIISEIFSQLDESGYLSESLVIITSDHGESLGTNGYFGHGNFLNQDELRIPILIFDEDMGLLENISFATHVDIAPTILEALKISHPDAWQGSSMFNFSYPRFNFHFGLGNTFCLTYVDKKRIIWMTNNDEEKGLVGKSTYTIDESFVIKECSLNDSLYKLLEEKFINH